jgi:hypothetical protein
MEVSSELESKLALRNDTVQIQVCSDYNFHSEEEFKVNYWTRVILVIAGESSSHLGGVTPLSLKQWWVKYISPRSLPGLRKVLLTAVNQSRDLIILSEIRNKYNTCFNIPVTPGESTQKNQGPSLVSRIASSFWRMALGGDNSDGEDSPTAKAPMIDQNEVIFSQEILKKFSGTVLYALQTRAGLDGGPLESILVTEADVASVCSDIMKKSCIQIPFAALTPQVVNMCVISCLVETYRAIPFTVDRFNCLKLPPVDSSESPESVTERDKAYLMSAIASEKLMTQETALTEQWNAVDAKLKEHLRAGRKPLALNALKERKMVEQRLEEIQIYKLKLAESSSVTQTAVIQKAVITAIQVGNQATRSTVDQVADEAAEIVEQAEELRNEVNLISQSITGTATDIDDAVLLEYEELVKERDQDKEGSLKEALIDAIPAPPTAPIESPIQETAPPANVIVPEEWYNDLQ